MVKCPRLSLLRQEYHKVKDSMRKILRFGKIAEEVHIYGNRPAEWRNSSAAADPSDLPSTATGFRLPPPRSDTHAHANLAFDILQGQIRRRPSGQSSKAVAWSYSQSTPVFHRSEQHSERDAILYNSQEQVEQHQPPMSHTSAYAPNGANTMPSTFVHTRLDLLGDATVDSRQPRPNTYQSSEAQLQAGPEYVRALPNSTPEPARNDSPGQVTSGPAGLLDADPELRATLSPVAKLKGTSSRVSAAGTPPRPAETGILKRRYLRQVSAGRPISGSDEQLTSWLLEWIALPTDDKRPRTIAYLRTQTNLGAAHYRSALWYACDLIADDHHDVFEHLARLRQGGDAVVMEREVLKCFAEWEQLLQMGVPNQEDDDYLDAWRDCVIQAGVWLDYVGSALKELRERSLGLKTENAQARRRSL